MHVLLMRGKAKDDITYDLHDSIMGQHIFAIKKKETIHTHAHTQNIYIYIYHTVNLFSRLVSKWKLNHMI